MAISIEEAKKQLDATCADVERYRGIYEQAVYDGLMTEKGMQFFLNELFPVCYDRIDIAHKTYNTIKVSEHHK